MFPTLLNQTVTEAKEETREGNKEKDGKGYEKKGRPTCINSGRTATYWLEEACRG